MNPERVYYSFLLRLPRRNHPTYDEGLRDMRDALRSRDALNLPR